METVLKTSALTKIYGNKSVVSDVNLNIKKGEIYGFIGRNGAGKTTLIRMVLGLANPTRGKIELFEQTDLEKARRRIGSIVEMPSFYPDMSAKQNMEAHRLMLGIKDKTVGDTLLKKVGLTDAAKKRAKNFSLGMKQRLGIALALMGDPEFLILDEPVNGLDPNGIKEVRDLLIDLNKNQGITVLISSHLLSELSKFATRYGIINEGKLIDEFTSADLEERFQPSLLIKVNNTEKAIEIIQRELNTRNFKIRDDNLIELAGFVDQSGKVNTLLAKNDLEVESINKTQADLEDYFLKMTTPSESNK